MNKENQILIKEAMEALEDRGFHATFPEHPKAYPEDAEPRGLDAFKARLGKPFEALKQSGTGYIGEEVSPYTGEPLGIKYPNRGVEQLIELASKSLDSWRDVPVQSRADMLVESLKRFADRFFEVAHATMHTTGQGYMMAFQAGGPHAADRAMEAIALGVQEQNRYPSQKIWDKPMGKFNLTLEKSWKNYPKGISLAIGCSTFPIWNSAPGIYASLVTGNTVIVKPHPGAILPLAILVSIIRDVLRENGFDPEICQLAADTPGSPLAKILAEHKAIKIIDFTGNSTFGSYLEGLKGKAVFTEKTGVNSVILHSTSQIEEMAANLAFSLCLYSGQMCTAPQNFFIPEDGIDTPEGKISFDAVVDKIAGHVSGLVDNPKAGPYVLGAIQNALTCEKIEKLSLKGTTSVLNSKKVENPQFPKARTMSPGILKTDSSNIGLFSSELFGPVSVMIKVKNVDEAIDLASGLAKEHGAISCAAYTTDKVVMEKITDAMGMAATPVSFNLIGPIYVNQNAGFSDFHVTGGNPSGNASLTDPAFVAGRFTRVGFRKPA